jgi:hypothetical protein
MISHITDGIDISLTKAPISALPRSSWLSEKTSGLKAFSLYNLGGLGYYGSLHHIFKFRGPQDMIVNSGDYGQIGRGHASTLG